MPVRTAGIGQVSGSHSPARGSDVVAGARAARGRQLQVRDVAWCTDGSDAWRRGLGTKAYTIQKLENCQDTDSSLKIKIAQSVLELTQSIITA